MSSHPSQSNSAMSWCGLGGDECSYGEPVCTIHALLAKNQQLREQLQELREALNLVVFTARFDSKPYEIARQALAAVGEE